MVASYDFTRRAELRRWIPPSVTCTLTFTEEVSYQDNLELVSRLGRPNLLAGPVRELVDRGAEAVAYLCTACSFVNGVAGERALRDTMTEHGARQALTTSSAIIAALRAVGARRLAVVHPYQEPVDRLLATYLEASGFDVVALSSLGLDAVEDVYTVDEQRVQETVVAGDHSAADALLISCTAVPTYEALPHLEERLGKPVISANQATSCALLAAVGVRACGPGQRLL
ncbi:Asp/Glu racemase [Streptomyces sp. VRA16 Mangrove soil]|uniref:maleate cis-trans isomerase family protein n=1 Tax=Streptomyces sp. VRA16 Mangrove soil TaxID=2817434 RepID=UPI001A9E1016|nr:Asp/Glu racemase [Streptomyces sp. VRA16 Mangrove soil]MBO1330497.1 Asp/Glu racemase [Streptomyces sp. VRA16 Mangrove soil]